MNLKEPIMPVHTAENPMPFVAQHMLGQLIKASGVYPSGVTFQLQRSDESVPEDERMPDSFELVSEISTYTILDESNGVKQRFRIIERFEMDEDEQIFVFLTHQFLEWPGKEQFLRIFEGTKRPLH
jgi:hypothetical protein